ncbi:hypothetical protein [Jannaschia donghaensis]|uniref:Polymer-forming cytoskeletal n=1 Tax=Jannaschia donghaensis TaxID=420998 RepID=A0A0M6YJ21_9RHOB|nr:hypothetical protein [Jannaschia donghaensis]CTQ50358.1 hypothetical protein JDO7802_02381 [Jannaschia donghaensis]
MTARHAIVLSLALLIGTGPVGAERRDVEFGGDRLVTGGQLEETTAAARDVLISGARIVLRGDVGDDLLAAAFDVDVEAATGGDLTAAGARVRLDGRAGGDATLTGFIVTLDDDAVVEGNARLFAATATQRGVVEGSLLLVAGDARLEGVVGGDLRVVAETLTFGPDARVEGRLTLALPQDVVVPADVAPAGRVSYEYVDGVGWRDYDELAWEGVPDPPSAAAIGGGFLLGLAFLLITGGTLLALMPQRVASMRRLALARPGITVLIGALGFATLVGSIPVAAMTVVGLPLVPLAILFVVLGWLLGYLLGAYVVAMGIARALGLGDLPSIPARLGVLAGAITVAAILNFIPFLGWILNVALVFLGVGAMTEGGLRAVMARVGPDNGIMQPDEE